MEALLLRFVRSLRSRKDNNYSLLGVQGLWKQIQNVKICGLKAWSGVTSIGDAIKCPKEASFLKDTNSRYAQDAQESF